MPVSKPCFRTCRQFNDNTYTGSGRAQYLVDPRFAKDPAHYIQAFLLIRQDLLELFTYVEPADENLRTYSHRIHQLLTRTCIEVEANLTAILIENGYQQNSRNLNMNDYRKVNLSHHLSDYQARVPIWRHSRHIVSPFVAWNDPRSALPWYQSYNKAKHDRHRAFQIATFDCLIAAFCGLFVLLSSQFLRDFYTPHGNIGTWEGIYRYDKNDDMESGIGNFLRIKFPDWSPNEQYDIDWPTLERSSEPFDSFPY